MSGVFLRGITNVLTVPDKTTIQTLYQLTAASHHGFLIYKIRLEINGNGRSATKIAQVTVFKPATAGSAFASEQDPVKMSDRDDETVQTDGKELAGVEPIGGTIIDVKQVAIGGSGITAVVFHYPDGLKIDGWDGSAGTDIAIAITEDDDPGAGAHAKCRVIVDLEE